MIAMICKVLADKHQEGAKTKHISSEELMNSLQVTNAKILVRKQRVNSEQMRQTRNTISRIQEINSNCVISQDITGVYLSI